MRGLKQGNFAAWLLVIVAAGVAIRVLYTLLEAPWPPPALDDQFDFRIGAQLLAEGHGFIRPTEYVFNGRSIATAQHPPLYTLVLAGLAKLGTTSPDVQRLTGTVFGAGTIAAAGLLGRRVAGDRAGLAAAGLAAVYPVLIAADGALMSESLFGLLAALTLLAAYRLLDAPTVGRALAFGAVAGLATLTRGEMLLLLPLLLIPFVRRREAWTAVLVSVLACVVVLAPWTIRNWIVFDQPVLVSTNSGGSVAGANCERTYYGDALGYWALECIRQHPGNEAQRLDESRRDGVRYARDHAGRVPVVAAARVGRVWSVYKPFQLPEGRSGRVHKLGVAMFFLLLGLAAWGAVLLRRRRAELWILLAPFVAVTVTALTSYGNVRFRESADVALVVLAGVAVAASFPRLLRLRR
jgi:4-amino-4-deoxy-L-arabinose transferase-like glycosyltransferase